MKKWNDTSLSDSGLKGLFESACQGEIIARKILFHASVTSTNEVALEIGRQRNDPEGIVVVADAQSRGRGRFGRNWISPPWVNLYFTALLKPAFEEKEAPLLVLMAAVAVVTAIRKHTGLSAEIKWPNDILINGRKTGGILLEMRSAHGRQALIALGIGINVNMPIHMIPCSGRAGVTSIREEGGHDVDRIGLFREVLTQIEEWYKILVRGDSSLLLKEWRQFDSTFGRMISLKRMPSSTLGDGNNPHSADISGIAEGIDTEGRLLIRIPSGEVMKMSAGDVTILRNEI